MNYLKNFYLKSPVWIQNVLCSIYGYYLNYTRFNKVFLNFLNIYNSHNSEEGQLNYQSDKLREIMRIASGSIFWQKRFTKYGVNIDADNIYKEVGKLPILTKQEVRDNLETIINDDYRGKRKKIHTSGTTGSGLRFLSTQEAEQSQWAVWWRYRLKHGIALNTWQAWFGGQTVVPINQNNPPFWRINYPGKQVLFSQYHLNLQSASLYFEQIRKRKIPWIHGYPSQISLFASYVKELNLGRLPDLRFITIGAENLLAHQKQLMEEVFNVPVRQHYGLAEAVANISESTDGELLLDQDFCYVEFIPLSQNSPEKCKIIGTNLVNHAFPLIRYDTSDMAEIKYLDNDFIRILSIDGRREDFLTLTDGAKVGRLDHIFKDLVYIKEAQILQKKQGVAKFLIVKNKGYDENMEEVFLRKEINSRLSGRIKYSIEYVNQINKTKNGKLRLVLSTI